MLSKHCNACGADAHPKMRHPSSFRFESSVWTLAIVVGLFAGTLSAARSESSPTLSSVFQSVRLSAAQTTELPADVQQTNSGASQSVGILFTTWATRNIIDFLKYAWWVLPLPILFSLWRQFKVFQVCGHCGARELVPVPVAHGDERPRW